MPSIADQFADAFAAAGIKRIYGIVELAACAGSCGPANLHLMDTAIRESIGKRGVSVVVISCDIALQPAAAELDRLAALLNVDDQLAFQSQTKGFVS